MPKAYRKHSPGGAQGLDASTDWKKE